MSSRGDRFDLPQPTHPSTTDRSTRSGGPGAGRLRGRRQRMKRRAMKAQPLGRIDTMRKIVVSEITPAADSDPTHTIKPIRVSTDLTPNRLDQLPTTSRTLPPTGPPTSNPFRIGINALRTGSRTTHKTPPFPLTGSETHAPNPPGRVSTCTREGDKHAPTRPGRPNRRTPGTSNARRQQACMRPTVFCTLATDARPGPAPSKAPDERCQVAESEDT